MTSLYLTRELVAEGYFDGAVGRILELQQPCGAIPWYDDGVVDPWNHTEAAMGLTVLGRLKQARAAYGYLRDTQLSDGSWWSQYGAAVPMDDNRYTGDGDEKKIRDTNFCAYPATGIWHYYLVTGDTDFLGTHWPMVEAATDFVISLQTEYGDVRWAAPDEHTPEDDALVTGCSSIYKSLLFAYRLSAAVGCTRPDWLTARTALGTALREKPYRFDRHWEKKDNFSMDWFYPVIAGVFLGQAARDRLAARWDAFVSEGRGCRCVLEQPWVTVAESAELVIALLASGQRARAAEVLSWLHQWRDDAGRYWMGYQYVSGVPWPDEKPAWTAAAVILATDALLGLTPANGLFLDQGADLAPVLADG